MILKFLAKIGDLISSVTNPLQPILNKSEYDHIRAYTAGNLNIDTIGFWVVLPLAYKKILNRNDVLLFLFFVFGCFFVAALFDHLDSKKSSSS